MYAMLIVIESIEGGHKDVSSQEGTKLKKKVYFGVDKNTFNNFYRKVSSLGG